MEVLLLWLSGGPKKENQYAYLISYLISVIDFPQCAPGKGMGGQGFMACTGPHNRLILIDLVSIVY